MIENLSRWLKGNPDAIEMVLMIHNIVETWDDLIDRDKPLENDAIDAAFIEALIHLPRNRFYAQYFHILSPVFESAILDWRTANHLEREKEPEGIRSAYVLRCGFLALTVMSARIIGGFGWAQQVNNEMRKLGDTWADYSADFGVK